MPDFTTVSITQAQLQTTSGRQKTFLHEYISYIQQLPKGQAGRLTAGESENPLTIRRRLVSAAKVMDIPLIIKRSGNDLYFWREYGDNEQPRPRRGRRPRSGRPGSLYPPTTQFSAPEEVGRPQAGEQEGGEAETTPLDQAFTAVE
jgi:hypothetical protein